MTFMEETIQQNLEIWEACYQHPFIKEICTYQMSEEKFLHYLIEDTKYLKDYARVFGMGIFKSTSMEEICLLFEMLKFVESCESAARVKMLKHAGYSIEEIEQQPQADITKAYTSFLVETAQKECMLSILFATLPCMLSYAYIGKRLMEEYPMAPEESPYGSWILEYVCDEYKQKCRDWMQAADRLSEHVSQEEKRHLQELFHTASQHELYFWNMSNQKKG